MTSHIRRLCGDALISATVLATVIGVLVSVDARLRERLQIAITSGPSAIGWDVQTRWDDIGYLLFDAARTQSIDHAPLMIFVACATALLLFMWRT